MTATASANPGGEPIGDASAASPRALAARLGMCAVGALAFSLYFVTQHLGTAGYRTLSTPVDTGTPFWPGWEWVYASIYLTAFLPAVQIRDLTLLKRALIGLVIVQIIANAIFITFPVRMERPDHLIDPARSFTEWGTALNFVLDPPINCFPSLHVANAFYVCLIAWSLDRAIGAAALLWATLIAVSTMLVKQHWLADVTSGTLLAWLAWRFLFVPHIPENVARHELVLPRRVLFLLPFLFASIVGVLLVLWTWKYSFAWPPPAVR